ncbi:hypothetical protein [Paraferrimonas sedimenticola]|uniref:Uncharacterized protein n=1 Tax=Paraferrimonas sedimenticola TaxID=375674 RepID=A0AA37RZF7_9GAMM|nr:hypothetical protein [Paraferrimonas sedimenticola]GLP98033.1 hypothetical protein GCM10007895_33400 [Paraferrimonas sedimenticola]
MAEQHAAQGKEHQGYQGSYPHWFDWLSEMHDDYPKDCRRQTPVKNSMLKYEVAFAF